MNARETRDPCSPRGAGDFCLSCVLTSGLLVAAVVASFAYLEIDFGALFAADSATAMARFAASFFPPDLAPDFLQKTAHGALQTFAVAMIGTLLAALAGLLLALPASGRHGIAAGRLSRFLLNLLRSVPELVWATLMVLAAGLGPFAGVLALALHTTGVLGRLFAEAMSSAQGRAPFRADAAALALFVEKGFAATRLDDVAARAGVSKGTLYLYFESKEALFKAVIEEGMVAALAAAEERLSDYQGSAAELLHELLLGWWEQIGQTPMAGVTKLIACESRNFPEVAQYYHERVISRGRALLRTTLQRGIASGEFRPVDVEAAIDVIIAPLLMLAISRFSLRLAGRRCRPETYLRDAFRPAGARLAGCRAPS
jgi:AcrR family transcriptional regulator